MKWDAGERKRSTIRIVTDDSNNGVRDIRTHDKGTYIPILKLDCDGLEPYAFHPLGEEFSATIREGVTMDSIDLSRGEWNYYDISYGSSSIKNFHTKFE
jgi:hypothetical protein